MGLKIPSLNGSSERVESLSPRRRDKRSQGGRPILRRFGSFGRLNQQFFEKAAIAYHFFDQMAVPQGCKSPLTADARDGL
jgi:hypothetical protein